MNVSPSSPPATDPQTFAIIGAAMTVHHALGCGFLESVYKAAMHAELRAVGMPFRTEVPFHVTYRGEMLPLLYRADLVCFEAVIVEIKAVKTLSPIDHAQTLNYLKVSGLRRALLLNFGSRSLEYRRLVLG